MTRLVNNERDRIRRAIMADVPMEDYDGAAQKRALTLAINTLPVAARRLWEDTTERGLLKTNSVNVPWAKSERVEGAWYAFTFGLPGHVDKLDPLLKTDEGLRRLAKDKEAQLMARGQLNRQLQNNLAACGTHEVFAERFPDLKDYLPDGSEAKNENLPATTDLIDGLKAAGLPIPKVDKGLKAA